MEKSFITLILLSSITFYLGIVQGTNSENLTLKFQSECGYYNGVTSLGDTMILSNGGYIEFWNLSNEKESGFINKLWVGCNASNILVDSCYLFYCLGYDGLKIIDISSLENPQVVNQCDDMQKCYDACKYGNYLATTNNNNLEIYNISDISSIELINSYSNLGSVRNLKKFEQYLLVGTNNGLWIYDFSNPEYPVEKCHILSSVYIKDTHIFNNKLFINDGTENTLRIFDISNISFPYEISSIPLMYNSYYKMDNYYTILYIGNSVIDISDVNNPKIVTKLSKEYVNFCVLKNSNILIGTARGPADIFDISNPKYPVQIQNEMINSLIGVESIKKYKNKLFSEGHDLGITVWDNSSQYNPVIIQNYPDAEGNLLGTYFDRLYVSNINYNTLEVYNVRNALFLECLLSSYNIGGISFNRGVAYCTGGFQSWNNENYSWKYGLFTLDISNLDNNKLNLIDEIYLSSAIVNAINDSVLFVSKGYSPLLIYDIKNPRTPIFLQEVNIGRINEIVIADDYLYKSEISYENCGIRIYDISNPISPVEVHRINTYGINNYPKFLNTSQNFLYFYDLDTIKVYDISNPQTPTKVGYYANKYVEDMVVDNNLIYCANRYLGMNILKNELADSTSSYIQLSMTKPETFERCSVNVDLFVDFPVNSAFNSFEIDIEGDFSTLIPVSVTLNPDNQSLSSWNIETNYSPSEISIAAAGIDTSFDDGKLLTITFYIDTTELSYFPLTIKNALWGEESNSIITLDGGIFIKPPIIIGDVSINRKIQAEDAALILKHIVNLDTLNADQLLRADVTLDSTISALDATYILKYCVGSIDTLPYSGSQDSLFANLTLGLYEDFITPGYVFKLPLSFHQYSNIKSCEAVVTFPSEYLEYRKAIINQDITNFEINDITDGKVKIAFACEIPSSDYYCPFEIEFLMKDCGYETHVDVLVDKLKVNENILFEKEKIGFLFNDLGIETNNIPKEFQLYQNYPNPFNSSTTIQYDLPINSNVRINVYDISGKLITTLVDNYQDAGKYNLIWDAPQLSSGLYIYQIETSNYRNIKKSILIK